MDKFHDRVERFLSTHPALVALVLSIMQSIVIPIIVSLLPVLIHPQY